MGEDATVEALMSTDGNPDPSLDDLWEGDIPDDRWEGDIPLGIPAAIQAAPPGMAWSASAEAAPVAAGSTLAIRGRSAAASPPIETPSEPRVIPFTDLASFLAGDPHRCLGSTRGSDGVSNDRCLGGHAMETGTNALPDTGCQ